MQFDYIALIAIALLGLVLYAFAQAHYHTKEMVRRKEELRVTKTKREVDPVWRQETTTKERHVVRPVDLDRGPGYD